MSILAAKSRQCKCGFTLFNVIDFTNEVVKSISIVQRVLHELKKHEWSALKSMVCKKYGSDKKPIPILYVMSVKPMMSVILPLLRSNSLRDVRKPMS